MVQEKLRLGMDLENDKDLMWIARAGLKVGKSFPKPSKSLPLSGPLATSLEALHHGRGCPKGTRKLCILRKLIPCSAARAFFLRRTRCFTSTSTLAKVPPTQLAYVKTSFSSCSYSRSGIIHVMSTIGCSTKKKEQKSWRLSLWTGGQTSEMLSGWRLKCSWTSHVCHPSELLWLWLKAQKRNQQHLQLIIMYSNMLILGKANKLRFFEHGEDLRFRRFAQIAWPATFDCQRCHGRDRHSGQHGGPRRLCCNSTDAFDMRYLHQGPLCKIGCGRHAA